MKLLRNLSEIFIIYRGNFQHANQVGEGGERKRLLFHMQIYNSDCPIEYNIHRM